MIGVEKNENKELIKREIIEQHGTIIDFAKKFGFRRSTIYDYLNNKQEIRSNTLFCILDKLGLKIVKE